jgi:hypothetical protein
MQSQQNDENDNYQVSSLVIQYNVYLVGNLMFLIV